MFLKWAAVVNTTACLLSGGPVPGPLLLPVPRLIINVCPAVEIRWAPVQQTVPGLRPASLLAICSQTISHYNSAMRSCYLPAGRHISLAFLAAAFVLLLSTACSAETMQASYLQS